MSRTRARTPRALGQRGTPPTAPGPPSHAASSARWRAWSPLLVRALAVFIALLGLAGIGRVASQTPLLPAPAHALAQAGLDFGAGRGLAVLAGSAPAPRGPPGLRQAPADPAAPTPAGSEPADAAPVSTGTEPPRLVAVPCPTLPARDASSPPALSPGLTADGRVILNRASALDLQRLPGVGARRAAAILDLRQRLGRFRNPGDLLRIKGIGRRTLERMLPQLVLDASDTSSARAGARTQP
jgi:competence protein ComEA